MSFTIRASSQALLLAGLLLAGCANDGTTSLFTTGALGTQPEQVAAQEPKVDPVCVTLVSRIEGLHKEGVAEKIEKAATKKYTMTKSDLAKADQLTTANAEVQLRCSTIAPKLIQAQAPASATPLPAAKAPAPKTPKASPKAAAATTPSSAQN
jgi:hypothetical protein